MLARIDRLADPSCLDLCLGRLEIPPGLVLPMSARLDLLLEPTRLDVRSRTTRLNLQPGSGCLYLQLVPIKVFLNLFCHNKKYKLKIKSSLSKMNSLYMLDSLFLIKTNLSTTRTPQKSKTLSRYKSASKD